MEFVVDPLETVEMVSPDGSTCFCNPICFCSPICIKGDGFDPILR